MTGVRLLLVTNERRDGDEFGLRAEFESLLHAGVLDAYQAVAPEAIALATDSWADAMRTLNEAAASTQPSHVLVLSPKAGPWTDGDVQGCLRAAGATPTVIYWEGDPWGRRNPPNHAMALWLRAADQVFTTALGEQYDLLRRSGADRVRFVANTYCHVQFAAAEATWTPPTAEAAHRVVMVGNRSGRIPGISRVPGSRSRWRLARMASRSLDGDLTIYGRGWRGERSGGRVRYEEQARVIREAGVSINWDHYPHHRAYASDRLPISLIAGRAHVTTRHPDMDWLPAESAGLFLAESPSDVVDLAAEIRSRPVPEIAGLGRAAHTWVRDRLSDRQAARYLLAEGSQLELPLPDPWPLIATMGDGAA
jgi:hypothetical protein